MTDTLQAIAIAISTALLAAVLEMVRRRRITEEYSLVWILCAGALLVLSVWRDILHVAARTLGVHYPPAVLLLVLILFVFLISLHFSVVLSRQRRQIERLVEDVALLDAELRELRESVGPVATADVVPHAAGNRAQPADRRYVARQ
jgi:hypothetical protein